MVQFYFTKHFSKFPILRKFPNKKMSKSTFYEQFRTKKNMVKNLRTSPLSYSVCLEVNTIMFLRTFGNLFVSTNVSAVFRRKLQRFTQFPKKITQNYERFFRSLS